MLTFKKSIGLLFRGSFQFPFLRLPFTTFPSKKDLEPFKTPKILNLEDELFFPHLNEGINGGFPLLVENLNKQPETIISGRGASLLIYNCGVKNLHEPQLFKMVERDIAKYRGTLEPRQIFGGLYGVLKTNAASPFLMDFFMEEFENYMAKIEDNVDHEGKPVDPSPKYSNKEFYELLEACSYNETLKKEKLHKFVIDHIKAAVLAQGKFISYKNCVAVLKHLEKMELYDRELWEVALNKLEKRIRFNNLVFIQSFYDVILRSKNSGKNPIDLSKLIQRLQQKLKSKADYRWRYDVESNHFYTFEELKAKRDDYQFPEQSMNIHTPFHRQRLATYNMEYSENVELAAKKKKLTLEKELEQMTFDRFMRKKSLESKGAIDELEGDDYDPLRIKDPEKRKRAIAQHKLERKYLTGENIGGDDEELQAAAMKKESTATEEMDEGDIEEEEKKAKREAKEAQKKKILLEEKKREKAKLGKGKVKAEQKRMREEEFNSQKDEE